MLTALYLAALLGSTAEPPRPFRGLRAELNGADAVLRIRAVAIQTLDPGWDGSRFPERQEVDAVVKKVFAGSVARPGQRIRLSFAARQNADRARSMSSFLSGVGTESDLTALVKRDGDRLALVTLMSANDVERTDAFFEAYARLARLDDIAFTLGLAELLADRVRLEPDRLLWVNWAWFAFDDWDRLKVAAPPADHRLRRLASETHRAILPQIDAVVRGGTDGRLLHVPYLFGLNLSELPWLIRLLSPAERRGMATRLLQLHPIFARDLEDARKAAEPPPGQAVPASEELTMQDMHAMGADADMSRLIHCLAVCVDPRAPLSYPREEALRRARKFVARTP